MNIETLFDVYLSALLYVKRIDEVSYNTHVLNRGVGGWAYALMVENNEESPILPCLADSRRAIRLIESFVDIESDIMVTTDGKSVVVLSLKEVEYAQV